MPKAAASFVSKNFCYEKLVKHRPGVPAVGRLRRRRQVKSKPSYEQSHEGDESPTKLPRSGPALKGGDGEGNGFGHEEGRQLEREAEQEGRQ